MGNLLIVGLVIAWIVVLGPSVFRRRDERGPSSLDAARDRLAALHVGRRSEYPSGPRGHGSGSGPLPGPRGSRPGGPVLATSAVRTGGSAVRPTQSNPFAPPSLRNRHQRRRAQILQILLGSCVLSLLLAIGTGVGSLWLLQLGVDAVLVSYVALLRSVATRSRGRRRLPTVGRESTLNTAGHALPVFDYADDYENVGYADQGLANYDHADDFSDFDDYDDFDGYDDADSAYSDRYGYGARRAVNG